MPKSKKPKVRWSPLTDAERAHVEDIGQPWDPPANMHRMPDGALYAPAEDLKAWREAIFKKISKECYEDTSDGELR